MIEIMVAVSSGGELGLCEGALSVSREVHELRSSPRWESRFLGEEFKIHSLESWFDMISQIRTETRKTWLKSRYHNQTWWLHRCLSMEYLIPPPALGPAWDEWSWSDRWTRSPGLTKKGQYGRRDQENPKKILPPVFPLENELFLSSFKVASSTMKLWYVRSKMESYIQHLID